MKKIKKKLKIMTTLFLTSVLITFSIIVHIINSKQSSLGFKKKKKKKKTKLSKYFTYQTHTKFHYIYI
jgi:preprotein translocase subunit SecG